MFTNPEACKYRVTLQISDRCDNVRPFCHTVVATSEEVAEGTATGTAAMLGLRVLGVVSVDPVH